MTGFRRIVLAALVAGLAQCGRPASVLPPFETVAPVVKNEPANASLRVSVCYNSFTTTADQVRAIAADSCGAETTPRPLERDLTLAHCPVLEPLRATFACEPAQQTR
jgi:hypothetical protein